MAIIHPTAVVAPEARISEGVRIHPHCFIGPGVTIGPDCSIGPNVCIDGTTTIGARTQVLPFASIGYPPQDIGYRGEDTRVEIGDDTVIRESVTIHRGTPKGGAVTRVGNKCYLMAYVHIAHDCQLGNEVIIASATMLGGHVQIDDYAIIGGLVAIHQFTRIGTYAFIGGKSGLRMDIPPFMLAFGSPARLYGPNIIGLRRRRFPPEAIHALKRCYHMLFRENLTLEAAIGGLREEFPARPEVATLLSFIESSTRGITRQGHDGQAAGW